MVYWGCGTERNRAAWAYVVTMAATGAALFILGAAKFDACRRLPPETTRPGDCGAPPRAMLIAGAAMIVAALPPLLFFSGCAAPPAAADGCEDGRAAAITVVRRAADGASSLLYQYDAAGRLVMGPDRFTEQAAAIAAKKPQQKWPADVGGPQPMFVSGDGPLRASRASIPAAWPSSMAGGDGACSEATAHHLALATRYQEPHAAGLTDGFGNPFPAAASSPNARRPASPFASAGPHFEPGTYAPSYA